MTAFVIIFEGPFFYQSSTRIFEPFWDSIYRFFSDRFFLKFQRFYLLQDGYIYTQYTHTYYTILYIYYIAIEIRDIIAKAARASERGEDFARDFFT